MNPLFALAAAVLLALLVVAVLRRSSRGNPSKPSSLTPQQLAEASEWKEGDDSPNGRRVLWVQPATRSLLSMTQGDGAPWFAAGCPVDINTLDGRLPDNCVELEVEWPVSDHHATRLFFGYRPEVMEDKWRIVGWMDSSNALRILFFRSWTGALMYVIECSSHAIRKLWAPANDALAAPMVRALLAGYLFDEPCVVPAPPELGEDKVKLMAQGIRWAGRHCDAVEPGVTTTGGASSGPQIV